MTKGWFSLVIIIIGILTTGLVMALYDSAIDNAKLHTQCLALCIDHRVIQCFPDDKKIVASCADTSSPSGYTAKSMNVK